MKRVLVTVLLTGCAFAFAGCGGDTGTAVGALTKAVTFSVDWGNVNNGGTGASRSAQVTLIGANPDGSNLSFPVSRSETIPDTGGTQNITSPSSIKTGLTQLLTTFYLSTTPGGAPVGTLQTQINVPTAPTTVPIDTSAPPGSTVAIAPNQTIYVGQTATLLYSIVDPNGNLVPTPATEVPTLAVDSGAADVVVTGLQIGGVAAGAPTLTLTLGTLISAPQAIAIVAKSAVTLSPPTATISVQGSQTFMANIVGLNSNALTWTVLEPNGGSVTQSGVYTAPTAPGTFHVVATSQFDSTVSGIATITVQAGGGSITIK